MKKHIGWPVIIMIIILLGCSLAGLILYRSSTPKVNDIKIGMVLYDGNDPFIVQTKAYVESYINDQNQKISRRISIDIEDSARNQSLQNEQINQFIANQYDLLIVNIVERQDAGMIIDKAQNADIPVIFFNREPVPQDIAKWEKVYYIGSKAEEAGRIQGEILADALDNGLKIDQNKDGKIQYVMLEGEYGHQDAILRTYHCIKVLEERGYSMENLARDTAMWQRVKGKQKMQEWYELFGEHIEVVMANNDEMALGAIEVLKEKGYFEEDLSIPVLGVDGLEEALQAIEEETLLGTVFNDSSEQAKCIVYKVNELTGIPADSQQFDINTQEENNYFWIKHRPIIKENIQSVENRTLNSKK